VSYRREDRTRTGTSAYASIRTRRRIPPTTKVVASSLILCEPTRNPSGLAGFVSVLESYPSTTATAKPPDSSPPTMFHAEAKQERTRRRPSSKQHSDSLRHRGDVSTHTFGYVFVRTTIRNPLTVARGRHVYAIRHENASPGLSPLVTVIRHRRGTPETNAKSLASHYTEASQPGAGACVVVTGRLAGEAHDGPAVGGDRRSADRPHTAHRSGDSAR